ncbi:hypothetical protein Q0Z83_044180 [Actinoplanes sichuanensis]|nr:hypothetical protein Q0Z83_044180 [Actinoplanes sichuanensis]
MLVSARRDAAQRFFTRVLATLKVVPVEVVTDAAAVYPAVLADLVPAAWHHVERYANNPVEADHGRLEHRLRPMRGLRTDRSAQTVIAGHAFMQNLRRGHYETVTPASVRRRVHRTRAGDLTQQPGRAERVSRSNNATAPVSAAVAGNSRFICRRSSGARDVGVDSASPLTEPARMPAPSEAGRSYRKGPPVTTG